MVPSLSHPLKSLVYVYVYRCEYVSGHIQIECVLYSAFPGKI